MLEARYAIYLAPPPDTPLWGFGSRVLGYDAATGEDLPGFAPPGFDPPRWRLATERPRTYGFHATLKAPFRLSDAASPADLEAELEAFGRTQAAFDLGPLAVMPIAQGGQGFAALKPIRPSNELAALERRVVEGFDHLRAPLTDDEVRSRRPDQLTPRQRESLLRFGYPHVGPDYQFHMTLSGSLSDAADVADALADAMANTIGGAHLRVDALALFRQERPGERFRAVRRFPLLGAG